MCSTESSFVPLSCGIWNKREGLRLEGCLGCYYNCQLVALDRMTLLIQEELSLGIKKEWDFQAERDMVSF